MITVAVVDDQSLLRMGLRVLIDSEADLELAGEAANGIEAMSLIRRTRPNVVLMDIRMPGMDGLATLAEITSDDQLAETKVVMLTTFDLDEYVFAALQAGAVGFCIKDADPEELLRAVRVAAAGESLLSPSVTTRVIGTFAGRAGRRSHPQLHSLTDRETEVLTLVGEGLNNDEIAGRLVISKATARTHVSRAMSKLAARDRAQLVIIAYQAGLVG